MPGWDVHRKAYEMIGLDASICSRIDVLLDESPPKAREVVPFVKEDIVLPVHFGLEKTYFPYMYNYVTKRYGVEGAKCFLTHIILDYIENSLKKGHDNEMIVNGIKEVMKKYYNECNENKEYCPYYNEVFNEVQRNIIDKVNNIILIVKEWLDQRILPIEKLLKASESLLSFILRVNLYAKGYQGKRGFSVDKEAYRKTYGRAKILLKQYVFKAIVDGEIKDTESIIKSINNIKKKEKTSAMRHLDLIINERRKNKEFNKYLSIISLVVNKAIEEYEKRKS